MNRIGTGPVGIARESYQRLDYAPKLLGLGQSRFNRLVPEQRGRHISIHRFAM